MKKRNILLNGLYIVFLTLVILSFLFMILGIGNRDADYSFDDKSVYSFNKGWIVFEGESEGVVMDLPVDLNSEYKKVIKIKNKLPKDMERYNCLMIESKRQDIFVYINNGLRKSYTDEGQRISKSLPYAYVLVPLHDYDGGKDIVLTITTDTYYSGNISDVYIGNEMSIVLMLLKQNFLWMFLVLGTCIVGLICLVGYVTYRKTFEHAVQYLYLFWFSFFSAFWCFTQLKIRQVFLGDIALFESGGYCSFLLIPISIVLVVNVATEYKYTRFYQSVLVCLMINFLTQNILHTGFSYDYFLMQNVTQLLILVILIVSIVLCIKVFLVVGINGTVESCIIGTLGYTIGILSEAISIALNKQYTIGSYFILGTYFFVTANLIGVFIYTNEEQKKKKDAESANQAKSQFLATMSHEIRTPINVVLGMNEMILRESNENVIRDYSTNIAEAGKSLLSLVNDILDFSKIESGKMDIVPVDYNMKPLLNDLIMMTTSRIGKKDIELVLDIDERIPSKYYGDEVRIKQIVTNILTNSAKYTEKGKIIFTVKNMGIDGDTINLYFSVKDTGIGIKEEDIKVLLESSFVRVDQQKNRNIEGTGLGLSITRQLLELMGSKLEIDSVYGNGSNFHFTLRQKIVDMAPMGSVSEKIKSSDRRASNTFTAPDVRILAVDDAKTNLLVVKGLLKPYKTNVKTASSGQECIDICREESFDLILMDHMMPGMDGIETLKRLKDNSLIGADTKVVALTANAISGAENMYSENGFDGYLTKPIDVNELDKCLRNNLSSSKIIES